MKRNEKSLVLRLINSFNYAINGIIVAVKTERNMKIHYGMAILVLIISLFFNLTKVEFILLCLTISLVIVSELINTAIEKTIDLLSPEYNYLAKIAKDMAAGAVLVAALNSVVVGYLLFIDRMNIVEEAIIQKMKSTPVHLTVVSILLVLILTLGLKAVLKKFSEGTHLQGGAVSGHSSLAFCSATIIATMADSTTITVLAYIMALLVAESRVEGKIHSVLEVVAGAVLGILVGVLVFQVLR